MMKTLIVALLVVLTLSLQAADAPEWLDDLCYVDMLFHRTPNSQAAELVPGYERCKQQTTMSVATIRGVAQRARDESHLKEALSHLPTQERRDNAYKTLISYTRWQPQPGFTADGAHGGHPQAMEHHK